jgi:nucleoid DNA-binding protein
MRKKEFVSIVSKRAGCTQLTTHNVLDAIKKTVHEQLINGEPAKIPNFGTFTLRTRAARYCSHPKTQQRILAKERIYLHFQPLKSF